MDWWKAVRAHPWITAVVVACTAGGAALMLALGLEGFSPLRSVIAGAIAGAGIAYMIVASRTLGAFADDEAADDEAARGASGRPPGSEDPT